VRVDVVMLDASADVEGTWKQRREIGDDGAILVRPDVHVGWRSTAAVARPAEVLTSALSKILGRS
jgi:2,4-dichlorophenol 6-monooxygenase